MKMQRTVPAVEPAADSSLVILAPLAGWAGPLDEVSDAVFADRLLGDGIAIDPTGSALHAPCAGEVISVHHSCHAVTLRADNGAELLLHIGLETVALSGNGFVAHVADGQRVAAGDQLVSFDLDYIATRAKSLVTPIILTNGETFAITGRGPNRLVAVGEPLFKLVARVVAASTADDGGQRVSRRFTVGLAHGVHARPAAAIANRARQFSAVVELCHGAKHADARSAVALMALGLVNGSEAEIAASGSDAKAALAALVPLFELALGENAAVDGSQPLPSTVRQSTFVPLPVAVTSAPSALSDGSLSGVTAAPGLAVGVAFRLGREKAASGAKGAGAEVESAALATALSRVRAKLTALSTTGSAAQRGIMAAHLTLLDDPEIHAAAGIAVAQGDGAAMAWSTALAPSITALRAVADPRVAARADDLLDLEYQVTAALEQSSIPANGPADTLMPAPTPIYPPELPVDAILLAHDLLPSQLISLDPARLAGIAIVGGGPTSHVAIIAAAMNIPAVVALGPALLDIADGTALILDADAATLHIAPAPALLDATRARLAERSRQHSAAAAAAVDDCRMADGTRIEIFANLGSLDEACAAVGNGAEGCGLLRTELLFLDRHDAPGIEEQAALYQAIATALDGRPLIVRTLDIGGDKPVPYIAIPPEDNPALGLRGIRVGLWQPALLRDQLTAILQVQPAGQCRILLPMVSDLAELIAVRQIVDELRAELGITAPVQLGVMIETPAAAVSADILAAQADFFAIGTNDLTQYTLAMDRGNAQLATQVDGLHPAVLRLIDQAVRGAAIHARPVGVCGGLASDLAAVPILIGLGVTELSATPALIPAVKALVRTLTLTDCAAIARQALAQSSAAEVRSLRLARQGCVPGKAE